MTEWNWDNREEWAKRVRSACYEEIPARSTVLADYASEEAARAIAELRQLWRQYGQRMRELQAKTPHRIRQSGESVGAWNKRWAAMSNDEQRAVEAVLVLQERRQIINRMIVELREGTVPVQHHSIPQLLADNPVPTVGVIMQRYEDACYRALDAYREEVAKRPIDDAAWEEELQFRRMMESKGIFTVDAR